MNRLMVLAAFLTCGATLPAQVSINFDATGAPCVFRDTAPLTTAYTSHGVVFSGGAAILNQCGHFATAVAHSGTDFLSLNGAIYPALATAQFSTAQNFFSVFVGSTTAYQFDFYLGGAHVTTLNASNLSPSVWTPVSETGLFDRVAFGPVDGTSVMTLDDLTTTHILITTPEPGSVGLVTLGLLCLSACACPCKC